MESKSFPLLAIFVSRGFPLETSIQGKRMKWITILLVGATITFLGCGATQEETKETREYRQQQIGMQLAQLNLSKKIVDQTGQTNTALGTLSTNVGNVNKRTDDIHTVLAEFKKNGLPRPVPVKVPTNNGVDMGGNNKPVANPALDAINAAKADRKAANERWEKIRKAVDGTDDAQLKKLSQAQVQEVLELHKKIWEKDAQIAALEKKVVEQQRKIGELQMRDQAQLRRHSNIYSGLSRENRRLQAELEEARRKRMGFCRRLQVYGIEALNALKGRQLKSDRIRDSL